MTSETGTGGVSPAFSAQGMVNAFTVDVEEHFQVEALAGVVSRASWTQWSSRVAANTGRLLELLASHRLRGTFFVLGWVAERQPALVRAIVAGGHELASHGYDHTRADRQTPDQFRADVTRAKAILEDLAGLPVQGYRAATYSIGRDNLWALAILAETGHRYSSSIAPFRHDLYGWPAAERFPWRPRPDGVVEIPVTTVQALGRRWPCGGGGFFRLYPYPLFRQLLRRVNQREGRPALFYCHPWELDPQQPLPPAGLSPKARFRHTLNLDRTAPRLERLLRDFRWDRLDRVFAGVLTDAFLMDD